MTLEPKKFEIQPPTRKSNQNLWNATKVHHARFLHCVDTHQIMNEQDHNWWQNNTRIICTGLQSDNLSKRIYHNQMQSSGAHTVYNHVDQVEVSSHGQRAG